MKTPGTDEVEKVFFWSDQSELCPNQSELYLDQSEPTGTTHMVEKFPFRLNRDEPALLMAPGLVTFFPLESNRAWTEQNFMAHWSQLVMNWERYVLNMDHNFDDA